MRAAIKLLRELIALPSVNPTFLPAGDSRAGEHRMADFLSATAALGGLAVEFREVLPGRANLLAHYSPPGPVQRRILLAPHMDTVGEPSMPDSMFQPRVINGRLHGRGACDTKGSIAAMITALLAVVKSSGRPRHTAITFVALIDEEDGQKGSRALARQGFASDLAIVGEPTCLKVVTAHKGDLWLRLETSGKSAHGARPELGRNAVHSMAQVVNILETEYAAMLRKRRHPVLGHPTVNVGSIRGGTQPNIVPDHCEISVDRRTIPGESEKGVRAEIRSLLRRHGLKARLVNTKEALCPSLETDHRMPLVRQFLAAARQHSPAGVDYFCDAAVLVEGGIPSVVFGPGDIAQAHTADEWISLTSLERAVEILKHFLLSMP